MCRPGAEPWRAEGPSAGFEFDAMPFGFIEAVPGQRHLDRSAQQPHPADAVLARQREPQIRPRGVVITSAATQQRLAWLRVDAEFTRTRERSERAVIVADEPADFT